MAVLAPWPKQKRRPCLSNGRQWEGRWVGAAQRTGAGGRLPGTMRAGGHGHPQARGEAPARWLQVYPSHVMLTQIPFCLGRSGLSGAEGRGAPARDALEGKGLPRRPQRRLGRRLEEVAKAVAGGYCRLQMPLRLALGATEAVFGPRLGALEGGRGGNFSPFQCIPGPCFASASIPTPVPGFSRLRKSRGHVTRYPPPVLQPASSQLGRPVVTPGRPPHDVPPARRIVGVFGKTEANRTPVSLALVGQTR